MGSIVENYVGDAQFVVRKTLVTVWRKGMNTEPPVNAWTVWPSNCREKPGSLQRNLPTTQQFAHGHAMTSAHPQRSQDEAAEVRKEPQQPFNVTRHSGSDKPRDSSPIARAWVGTRHITAGYSLLGRMSQPRAETLHDVALNRGSINTDRQKTKLDWTGRPSTGIL
ncbi:hypothetical protein L209DRAFT_83963 [Thermothelomyces heterothallicus CBS 203.75]